VIVLAAIYEPLGIPTKVLVGMHVRQRVDVLELCGTDVIAIAF